MEVLVTLLFDIDIMCDFTKAVAYVQDSRGPSMDNETRLNFYKLFKQATIGDCHQERPGILDIKGRAKWDAWNSVKGMSQDEAKKLYVDALTAKIPTWKN